MKAASAEVLLMNMDTGTQKASKSNNTGNELFSDTLKEQKAARADKKDDTKQTDKDDSNIKSDSADKGEAQKSQEADEKREAAADKEKGDKKEKESEEERQAAAKSEEDDDKDDEKEGGNVLPLWFNVNSPDSRGDSKGETRGDAKTAADASRNGLTNAIATALNGGGKGTSEEGTEQETSESGDRIRRFGSEFKLAETEKSPFDDLMKAKLLRQAAAASSGEGRALEMSAVNQRNGQAPLVTSPISASVSAATPTAANTPLSQTQSTLPQTTVEVPVNQKGWDKAMGKQLVWMAKNSPQEARIQLNPRSMGPIDVKVSVQQDQVQVNFVAQQANTREALETAMPRLKEMLEQSGLNLSQSDVSDQPAHRKGEGSGDGRGNHHGWESEEDAEQLASDTGEEVNHWHRSEISLDDRGVDYYA